MSDEGTPKGGTIAGLSPVSWPAISQPLALTFHHNKPTIIYLDGAGGSYTLSDDEAPRINSPREEAIIKALLAHAQSHFEAAPAQPAGFPPLGPRIGTLPS